MNFKQIYSFLMFSSLWLLTLNVLSGVTTHLRFQKHEPTPGMAIILLSVLPSPIAWLWQSYTSPIQAVILAYAISIISLLVSVSVYRISPLHPLYKYPGPFFSKLTKFWGVWIAIDGSTHTVHKRLHEKYGSIVRVGPNEISVVEKDMIPHILGGQGMPKGPLWEGRRFKIADDGNEYDSLIDVRDLQIHAELRKGYNKAFTSAAIKDYEDRMVSRVYQLRDKIASACEADPGGAGVVDMAKLLSFFSFDFMGDIAFGGCFELMRDGDRDGIWSKMEAGITLPAFVQHIPWIADAISKIPAVAKNLDEFKAFGLRNAQRRTKIELNQKDVFYHILDSMVNESASEEESLMVIAGNAMVVILAGSDTTASVMSNIFYYLLANPVVYRRLQKEIDESFPDDSPFTTEGLASLSFLNAVINEALRLQPALPTHLQRAPAKGSGGKLLGSSMFIPEGTAVVIPPYVLHRDTRYFSPNPEIFWPDRWISQDKSVVTDRSAFIPFSYGPANCPGRSLAMAEMRYVLALLVQSFDMSFNDGYDPKRWFVDLIDRFVFAKGDLPVKATIRNRV